MCMFLLLLEAVVYMAMVKVLHDLVKEMLLIYSLTISDELVVL